MVTRSEKESRIFEAEADLELALLEFYRAHGVAEPDLAMAVNDAFNAMEAV